MAARNQRSKAIGNFVSGGILKNAPPQQQQISQLINVPIPPNIETNQTQTRKIQSQPQRVQPQRVQPHPEKLNEVQPPPQSQQLNGANDKTVQDMDEANEGDDGPEKGFFKKHFGIKKKSSISIREKKLRQSKRLKKILHPKNALMALNELKSTKISDFVVNNKTGGGFIAEVTINNIQYEGCGSSKNQAKNDVCEKALRDIVISRMMQNAAKKSKDDENTADGEANGDDVLMKNADKGCEEDDVPMINLASFALFKLFTEWKNDGFKIPDFPHTPKGQKPESMEVEDKPKKVTIRRELPPNWEKMHPTTLLCLMRPGLSYTELDMEGTPPNAIQRVSVTVDEQDFIGSGRSKKIARRNVAATACNKIFNTNFENPE